MTSIFFLKSQTCSILCFIPVLLLLNSLSLYQEDVLWVPPRWIHSPPVLIPIRCVDFPGDAGVPEEHGPTGSGDVPAVRGEIRIRIRVVAVPG